MCDLDTTRVFLETFDSDSESLDLIVSLKGIGPVFPPELGKSSVS